MHLVVLHAPCLSKNKGDSARPIDLIDTWWKDTAALFHAHVHSDFVWVFADANAPINQDFEPYTGSHGAEPLNAQGRLFGEFLQDVGLFIPSTFDHFHHGPHGTWTHSNGSQYRRDYILVSRAVFDLTTSTKVLHDFDTTFCHADHVPVQHAAKGLLQCRANVQKPVRWDEAVSIDPARIRAFQNALATLPLPTWEVDVDQHKSWYEQQIFQLGTQFFAKQRQSKQRPTLAFTTLSKIAMKRHLLDCARAWGIVQDVDFKDCIKLVEKEVRAAVRFDLGVFYDQLLVHLQDSDCLGDAKTVFRLLTRFGRKSNRSTVGPRPLPMLQRPDGSLTTTYRQRQQVWMDQFAAIEAGQTMTKDALCHMARSNLQLPLDLQDPDSFPIVYGTFSKDFVGSKEDVHLVQMGSLLHSLKLGERYSRDNS